MLAARRAVCRDGHGDERSIRVQHLSRDRRNHPLRRPDHRPALDLRLRHCVYELRRDWRTDGVGRVEVACTRRYRPYRNYLYINGGAVDGLILTSGHPSLAT